MADVFISYKREDRALAEKVADGLRHEGFSVWWDDDITPREAWDATIEREISAAVCVVVLWSPRAVLSDWVRTEAHYAHDRGRLVPAVIEPCALPLAFSLAQTVNLADWSGQETHRHWRKLLTWIADLKAAADQPLGSGPPPANRFRNIVGQLANGEPVVDGALVNLATPAGSLFRDHADAPVMRVVPKGSFLLGASPLDPDAASVETPQKHVAIGQPFAVGVYPVLNGELARLLPASAQPTPPPRPRGLGAWFGDRATPQPPSEPKRGPDGAPATGVSCADAEAFIEALRALTGLPYRLLSEAEWEYACRAGSATRYSFGDDIDPSRALYRSDREPPSGPSPPGRYPPNGFGLFDMHGNVREWTQDSWQESHDLAPPDGRAVTQGLSSMRVTRGGGWSDPPSMLRCSARSRATHSIRSGVIGFRLARDL